MPVYMAFTLRAVTFSHRSPVHPKQEQHLLLLPALQKPSEMTLKCSVVQWQSQPKGAFAPQFPPTTAHFWPHTLLPLVVPAQLFTELSCKSWDREQSQSESSFMSLCGAAHLSSLPRCKPQPACSPCVLPLPPWGLG